MRKIVYSGFLKTFAVVLFITSMVFGVLTVVGGIVAYDAEDEQVYSFESDFSESWYIQHLLNEPEYAVFNAYLNAYREYDSYGNLVTQNSKKNSAQFAKNLQERFEDFYYSDEVDYYIQWNDMVITNCGAKNPEALMQGQCFSYVKRDGRGDVQRISTNNTRVYLMEDIEEFDSTSTIVISCSIAEETFSAYKALWEKQERLVINMVLQALACVIAAVLILIYLLCVCAKTPEGEYKNIWLDHIWIEVHLAAIAGAGMGAAAVCVGVLEEYMSGYFPQDLLDPVLGTAVALGSLVIITSLLSVIRNIKTRRMLTTSIILLALKWLFRLFLIAAKWTYRQAKALWVVLFNMLSKKTGIILSGMLFLYTALIGLFGIGTVFTPIWLVLGVLLFGFACFLIAYRSKDIDEIKKGVSQVRNGNVAYKIPEPKCEDMKVLAANINDIAKGLDESVSAKVKAERLKTELITNVSHDLKTPLTSIISYAQLLSKIEQLPEEARDYVSVIEKKSDRLKRLTQDLFDISKVQSGNDDVVLEKLDVSLLIQQALGEQDSEIQSSGLQFCVEAPKEQYIAADGRKMSRVVSNLLSNILKYTMKNTRVFITATETEDMVILEFKNISAYPLNFKAEEITQRFVRGDESRTTEGNGLGLAIAKSYTEICNGIFEIVADGDMFKAILKFKKYA